MIEAVSHVEIVIERSRGADKPTDMMCIGMSGPIAMDFELPKPKRALVAVVGHCNDCISFDPVMRGDLGESQ
jgi:hypothetical protein